MKRITIFFSIIVLSVAATVVAQNAINAATTAEQARIKPLIAAETKARETLNTKIATLPEAKAYNEARDALNKAAEALNKAAEGLPENAAWKEASAKVLDEAYKIQATHGLSSREFKPELDAKGDLVFTKLIPPKQ
jgi:hypothetical protein